MPFCGSLTGAVKEVLGFVARKSCIAGLAAGRIIFGKTDAADCVPAAASEKKTAKGDWSPEAPASAVSEAFGKVDDSGALAALFSNTGIPATFPASSNRGNDSHEIVFAGSVRAGKFTMPVAAVGPLLSEGSGTEEAGGAVPADNSEPACSAALGATVVVEMAGVAGKLAGAPGLEGSAAAVFAHAGATGKFATTTWAANSGSARISTAAPVLTFAGGVAGEGSTVKSAGDVTVVAVFRSSVSRPLITILEITPLNAGSLAISVGARNRLVSPSGSVGSGDIHICESLKRPLKEDSGKTTFVRIVPSGNETATGCPALIAEIGPGAGLPLKLGNKPAEEKRTDANCGEDKLSTIGGSAVAVADMLAAMGFAWEYAASWLWFNVP